MVLMILAIVLVLPLMISCTKAQEDKAFDSFLDKVTAKSPTPTKTEYISYNITLNLAVGKTQSSQSSPFESAYPQAVTLHMYIWGGGKEIDPKTIEKWTDKTGKITFSVYFPRVYRNDDVYRDDFIYYNYISNPPLCDWDLKTNSRGELISGAPTLNEISLRQITKGDIDNARFDEKNNCLYIIMNKTVFLGPTPAGSPTPIKSVTSTPTGASSPIPNKLR